MIRRSLALLAAMAALWPRPAGADHSVCKDEGGVLAPDEWVGYLAPFDGATDVPLDTRIWGAWASDTLLLVGAGGVEVPLLDWRTIDQSGMKLAVQTPAQLLEPDTVYQLWRCLPDACDSLLAEFRTGTELAAPPQVPVLLDQSLLPETRQYRVYLDVEFTGVLVLDDAAGTFDGTTWTGQIFASHGDPTRPVRLSDECGAPSWPYHSRSADLRFGAFNLAGEFSGWSDPEHVVAREGCDIAGAPSPPALLLILLAALRRRRPVTRDRSSLSTPRRAASAAAS